MNGIAGSTNEPPTSHRIDDDQWQRLRPWLTLAMVPGVGPLMRKNLLDHFGSAQAVLDASPAELQTVPQLGPKLSRAIKQAPGQVDIEGERVRCQQHGIDLLAPWHASYPELLNEISDPPAVLYASGTLTSADDLAVAIVGTRHASRYGREQALRLGAGLARAGVTVVSGLARGVDTQAHTGALQAGGRTIAVLGGGLLELYPRENVNLAKEISRSGAVLSEAATQAKPMRGSFPRRNRIITGLSLGVIVVEAGLRSGAMISARLAMEQNREVFAVPGNVDNRNARGCHQLLRDGATLVESVDDVLSELSPLSQPAVDEAGQEVRSPRELQLNDIERRVLSQIESQPTSMEDLVESTQLPIHRILSTVSVLEMKRLVRRLSGTQVVRI